MPILTLTNLPRRRALARLIVLSAATLALGTTWGCTRDGEGSTPDRRDGRSADSAAGALGFPTRKVAPYRVARVTTPGSIRGTVDASAVSVAQPTTCVGVAAAAPSSTSAVVWLEDIRSGLDVPAERKLERRLELSAARCRLEPRLQLALVGSTLNVRNDESVAHQVQLFRDGDTQPIYRIPFIFAGQLVPTQRPLTVPGVIEIRSTQDPSLRSTVVVVDHPYAAVVGADGRFVIDSIPPGRYRLMATNGAGIAEQEVQVSGDQTVSLRLLPN